MTDPIDPDDAPNFATGTQAWVNYVEAPNGPPGMRARPLTLLVGVYAVLAAGAAAYAADTGWWALLVIPVAATAAAGTQMILAFRGRANPGPGSNRTVPPWAAPDSKGNR